MAIFENILVSRSGRIRGCPAVLEDGQQALPVRGGAGDLKGMGCGANPVGEVAHLPVLLTGTDPGQDFPQCIQALRIAAGLVQAELLGIIELAQLPLAALVLRNPEILRLLPLSRKEHKGP